MNKLPMYPISICILTCSNLGNSIEVMERFNAEETKNKMAALYESHSYPKSKTAVVMEINHRGIPYYLRKRDYGVTLGSYEYIKRKIITDLVM